MKAVIMCGGIGSRLRPLTEVRPKPLIKLLNVPVLDRIIKKVISFGITDISISLGYMAGDIIEFCEIKNYAADIKYYEETKPLGTAGGVKNCIKSTDDTVFVVSGDNIFDLNITDAFDFHKITNSDFTLVCTKTEDPREYGTVVTDSNNKILSFIEKPSWENTESKLINTGIYIFNGKILDFIPDCVKYDFAQDLFPVLQKNNCNFKCFTSEGIWGDIGEFDAYLQLTKNQLITMPSGKVYIGHYYTKNETDENNNSFIAPCIIGDSISLGQNNTFGPYTVIGSACSFGSDTTVVDSVIGDKCIIGSFTDINKTVIDDGVFIGDNCCTESGAVIGYGVKVSRFSRLLANVKIWPGKIINPQSVVSGDMYFESPQKIDFDSFGISGKIFSQFTVSDAVKTGQALASLKGIKRIGVGFDGKTSSEIYKNLCVSGVLSCGAQCYDFEEMFKSQAYFYSSYAMLDAFIFISLDSDVINFSFFGERGMPIKATEARMINNNFKYNSFTFANPSDCSDAFQMNLLSQAYINALKKTAGTNLNGVGVQCECENAVLKKVFDEYISSNGGEPDKNSVQFLFNSLGTEMYCLENNRFYSLARLLITVAEYEFAAGHDIAIPEDAPDTIIKSAEKYGRKALRAYEASSVYETPDINIFSSSLWCFDCVFLAAKICGLIAVTGMSLGELTAVQPDVVMRKTVVEPNVEPQDIRKAILSSGAKKRDKNDVYYSLKTEKGDIKLRQLGNSSRVRVLVEAADIETAKEISGDIASKLNCGDIDIP